MESTVQYCGVVCVCLHACVCVCVCVCVCLKVLHTKLTKQPDMHNVAPFIAHTRNKLIGMFVIPVYTYLGVLVMHPLHVHVGFEFLEQN